VPESEHLAAIQEACAKAGHRFDPDRDVLRQASRRTLGQALAEAKRKKEPIAVLHLLCHGGPIGSTYGLMLDPDAAGDKPGVDGDRLASLLGEHADMVRLVLVIACDGGNQGELGNHLGSVAQAIHRAGVAAVVASRYPFSIEGANAFVRVFHEELLVPPGSVEDAFLKARQYVKQQSSSLDWAGVQLYSREDDGHDTRPIVVAPYRGLEAFEQKHERFFFGRDTEWMEILKELKELIDDKKPRFQVVEGASGTGKSSLVLAKVVPKLLNDGWRWARMVPGSDPKAALGAALDNLSSKEKKKDTDKTKRTLLVVDQFEEVFTQVPDKQRNERDALVQELWRMAGEPDGRLSVICTLRSDFRVRCEELTLEDKLKMDQLFTSERAVHNVFIPQMTRDNMKKAIEEPARLVGLDLDGLADTILRDVDEELGGLPLVQHALELLWQRREGRKLTRTSYKDMQGVIGALNQHAGQVIDELVEGDAATGRIARGLLVGLVQIGRGDAPNTRKRARLAKLRPGDAANAKRFDAVLRELVDRRLLVCSGKEDEQTVEVAHEALIRKWERLVKWIQEEQGNLLAQEDLERWVETFEKTKALLTQGQLELADKLAKADAELVTGEARELVERSRAEIERVTEAGRRARDTLRVTVAREHLETDPVVSAALLREVEASDPATIPSWFGCALAVARRSAMPTVIFGGHTGEVYSAQWSPDGTRIVTASADHTARVWDAATGRELSQLVGPAPVSWAAWNPKDGAQQVLTAENWRARVWNVTTGEAPLVGAINDFEWKVNGGVEAVAWSPTGDRIACGHHDNGRVQVWDAVTGVLLANLEGHASRATSVGWNQDGDRIVTISRDDTVVRVWDAATGEAQVTLLESPRDERKVTLVAASWSPDGARLMTAWLYGLVGIWSATGKGNPELWVEVGAGITSVAWSPDGTRLAVAYWDGTAIVLSATTGEHFARLVGHDSKVSMVAWSPDATRLVTASTDGTARVWNVATGEALDSARRVTATGRRLRGLRGYPGLILEAALPSGEASGSATNDPIKLLFERRGELLLEGHQGRVHEAAWSPRGAQIVTASGDTTARVWDAETGEEQTKLEGGPYGVNRASWSPDETQIMTISGHVDGAHHPLAGDAGGEAGLVCVWSPSGGAAQAMLPVQDEILAAVWSLHGLRIVTGDDQSHAWTARAWSGASGEAGAELGEPHESHPHRSVAWCLDGARILVTEVTDDGVDGRGVDGRVWNVMTGEAGAKLTGHKSHIWSASWSRDGARIVTASNDRTARVWCAATGQALVVLEGHKDSVNTASWSQDGARVATASNDFTARVWSAAGGELLATLPTGPLAFNVVALRPDGRRVVTASADLGGRSVRVWNLDAEHLRDRLWQATPLTLSARRRMALLDEDPITAEANAKRSREESSRRRAAHPEITLAVVRPYPVAPPIAPVAEAAPAEPTEPAESEASTEPAEPEASTEPAAPESTLPALAEPAAAAGAPREGIAQTETAPSKLRTLFQGAKQKVGELLAKLPGRPPGGG
jgi:WD40 repeat protein